MIRICVSVDHTGQGFINPAELLQEDNLSIDSQIRDSCLSPIILTPKTRTASLSC